MLATAQNRKWKILSHAVSNDDGRKTAIIIARICTQQAYWQRLRATCHPHGHRNQMSHARCIRQTTDVQVDNISMILIRVFHIKCSDDLPSRNSGVCCSTPNHHTFLHLFTEEALLTLLHVHFFHSKRSWIDWFCGNTA